MCRLTGKNRATQIGMFLSFFQAQRQLKKRGKFEGLSAGECRPSALVETRLDAMEELDEVQFLNKMDDSADIKNKIFFSVLVVSAIKITVQHICYTSFSFCKK